MGLVKSLLRDARATYGVGQAVSNHAALGVIAQRLISAQAGNRAFGTAMDELLHIGV
jgi:hypothetical protein